VTLLVKIWLWGAYENQKGPQKKIKPSQIKKKLKERGTKKTTWKTRAEMLGHKENGCGISPQKGNKKKKKKKKKELFARAKLLI